MTVSRANAVELLGLHDEKDALEAEPLRVRFFLLSLVFAVGLFLCAIWLRAPLVGIWSLLVGLTCVALGVSGSVRLKRISRLDSQIRQREYSAREEV